MNETDYTHTLTEEIRTLEEQLQKKKNALEGTSEATRPEKEVFKDVLREHIEKAIEEKPEPVQEITSVPPVPVHDYAAIQKQHVHTDSEHKDQIVALVEIALTKGVANAIKVARELKNPHLLDDFHDALLDDYYDKLVKAREIKT